MSNGAFFFLHQSRSSQYVGVTGCKAAWLSLRSQCSMPLVNHSILKHAPPVNFIPFSDAGGVQVCPHPEESTEGEAGHDAALRPQAA